MAKYDQMAYKVALISDYKHKVGVVYNFLGVAQLPRDLYIR